MGDNSRISNVSMDDSIIIPNPSSFSAESISILQCKLCPATFNTKKGLQRHLKTFMKLMLITILKTSKVLKERLKILTVIFFRMLIKKKKKAVYFYKCKLCSSSFKEKKAHDRHLKNIHSTDKDYKYNLQQGKKRERVSEKNKNYKKWK
jgi:hypothetical protein